MENKRCVQGRWLGAEEILSLRQWIEQRPQWSRKRLAKGLCEQWGWRDGRGRLKDFAARSLLLKLEATGQIKLPALQENKRRAPGSVAVLPLWEDPIPRPVTLAQQASGQRAVRAMGLARRPRPFEGFCRAQLAAEIGRHPAN